MTSSSSSVCRWNPSRPTCFRHPVPRDFKQHTLWIIDFLVVFYALLDGAHSRNRRAFACSMHIHESGLRSAFIGLWVHQKRRIYKYGSFFVTNVRPGSWILTSILFLLFVVRRFHSVDVAMDSYAEKILRITRKKCFSKWGACKFVRSTRPEHYGQCCSHTTVSSDNCCYKPIGSTGRSTKSR